MMAGFSLCYLYDPDPSHKSSCLDALHSTINNLWTPLEINNTWQTPNPDNLSYASADGSVYVTVTDGSRNITLHGSTWSAGTFQNSQPYDEWVWFCDHCWYRGVFAFNGVSPVRQNSDLGDTAAYQVSFVTDSTHAVLTSPYNSNGQCPFGCNKSMEIGVIVGLGTQPYMQAMLAGVFGTYVHQALVAAGPNYRDDLNMVRKFVADTLIFLQTSYDATGKGMFGGMNYVSCMGPYQYSNEFCAPGTSLSGEAMRGFAAGYALFPSAASKEIGNNIYNSMWGKPGFSSPVTPNAPCTPYTGKLLSACYLIDADDSSQGGYMLTVGDPRTNKWFGFFNGYGFGSAWPAVISRTPPNWKQR